MVASSPTAKVDARRAASGCRVYLNHSHHHYSTSIIVPRLFPNAYAPSALAESSSKWPDRCHDHLPQLPHLSAAHRANRIRTQSLRCLQNGFSPIIICASRGDLNRKCLLRFYSWHSISRVVLSIRSFIACTVLQHNARQNRRRWTGF